MAEKILIVDDDAHILRALERVLRPDGYDILKAASAEKALTLLRAHDVAAIICDFCLPELNGTEVLKQAISVRPDAVRIILTGMQEMDTIVEAINIGQVSQFVLKPWDEASLRQTINTAVETFRLCRANRQLQKKNEEQHEELVETHKVLRRDLEVGAKIHDLLLVDSIPEQLSGFMVDAINEPSRVIDGDFRVMLSPTDDVLDVVLGDVMGKGLPAAIVGTAVKTEITRYASPLQQLQVFDRNHFWEADLLSPAQVMQRVQDKLLKQLFDLGYFVSLFYARFDLRRRKLTYIDCGAPKPLHWCARTGAVHQLEGTNFPLGTLLEDKPIETEIEFQPDDLFLFYSDGLTEAQTDEGELFGVERIESLVKTQGQLPPRPLLHLLRKSVSHFSQKERFDDDLTLVAVRIQPDYVPKTSRCKTARFAADMAQLAAVREFVKNLCLTAPGDQETLVAQLELAAHEAFANICEHGYEGKVGSPVAIKGELSMDGVFIELSDQGLSFDPAEMEEPDLAGDRDGGFGVFMIREIADQLAYIPKQDPNGWNRLQIFKQYIRGTEMNFTHEKEDSVLVVTFDGDTLDAREAPAFKEAVTGLIAEESVDNVIFDLSSLQFIDSSGLGSLLSVLRHVNNRGGDLKLSGMSKPIRTMFEVVRMHKLFEIFNSRDEAVQSFQS